MYGADNFSRLRGVVETSLLSDSVEELRGTFGEKFVCILTVRLVERTKGKCNGECQREAFGVVQADRPEAIDGHIFDRKSVHRLTVVARGVRALVDRSLVWIAAPVDCLSDQMLDRVDCVLGAEHGAWAIAKRAAKHNERIGAASRSKTADE